MNNGTIKITATFFTTKDRVIRQFPNIFKKSVIKEQKKKVLEVGMSFNQMANGIMFDKHSEFDKDLKKFAKYQQEQNFDFIIEFCYCAYKAYCMLNNILQEINEKEFLLGFAEWLGEDDKNPKMIIEAIEKSQTFAVKKK